MRDWDKTIVARATALGQAAVGIVRLSGRDAVAVADRFVRAGAHASLADVPVRMMTTATIIIGDVTWDRCLAVRFAAPRSFTGEDVVELHLHGNPLIIDEVVRCAIASGARHAEAGEFTMRAVVNGKLDLVQAEAVGEAIAAESAAAVSAAQRQLGGELSARFHGFRNSVVAAIAQIELGLDFAEEGYSFLSQDDLVSLVDDLRTQIGELLRNYRSGARLRRGPRAILLGRPNAGKSSFFNSVLGYSRSLVSDRAGTTRDYLEERLVHRGSVIHLVDTAGLRSASDELEAEGVRRTRLLASEVDVALFLVDSTDANAIAEHADEVAVFREAYASVPVVPVFTKVDLVASPPSGVLSTTIEDASSIERVLDAALDAVSTVTTDTSVLVSQRQFELLQRIEDVLEQPVSEDMVLASAQLRELLVPLAALVGDTSNESVLDAVFRDFCIGK